MREAWPPAAVEDMKPEMVTRVLFLVAVVLLPCAYLGLCVWMLTKKIPRPPLVSYFLLFGVLGGWTFAFAMSPSGLAALSIVFLGVIAPMGTLLGAALVLRRRSLTWYHRCALYLSLSYPVAVVVAVLCVVLVSRSARWRWDGFVGGGAELERTRELYFGVYPDGRARLTWPGLIHVRITPTWLRHSDFRQTGEEILEFSAGELAALRWSTSAVERTPHPAVAAWHNWAALAGSRARSAHEADPSAEGEANTRIGRSGAADGEGGLAKREQTLNTTVRAVLLLMGAYALAFVMVAVVSGLVMLTMSPHACKEYSDTLGVLWATIGGAMCVCWVVVAFLAWRYLEGLLARGVVLTLYAVALLTMYVVIAFGLMLAFNCWAEGDEHRRRFPVLVPGRLGVNKVMGVLFAFLVLPVVALTVALIVGWAQWVELPPLALAGIALLVGALVFALLSKRSAANTAIADASPVHPGISMHAVPLAGGIGLVFVVGYLVMFWFGAPTYRPIVVGILALGVACGLGLIAIGRRRR
jgi:hypothetical protein